MTKRTTFLAAVLAAVFASWAAVGSARAEQAKSYGGKVTAINGRQITIAVSDGSTGNWTVAENATIGSGMQHFPLSDVHVGDQVSVAVTEDGVIHTLGVIHGGKAASKGGPSKTTGAKPTTAMWGELSKNGKDRWWRGEIININEKAKDFEIRQIDGKATTHFKADPKTNIYRGGKPPQKIGFGELKVGQVVEAVASGGKTIEVTIVK